MKLEYYKIVFVTIGIIGILLIASPTLGLFLRLPAEAQFSELYLLGSGHMAEGYPSDVVVGQNYSIYVDVGNHMGSSAYYVVYTKLQNESDPTPNTTSGTPSPAEDLFEYRFLVENNQTVENQLTFSVRDATFSGNQSLVRSFEINNVVFNLDKPATRSVNTSTFKYRLLLELWMYDSQSGTVLFNDRYVVLQLNLSQPS